MKSLLEQTMERRAAFRADPELYFPWIMKRCTVRILLVADSFIDFSTHDFGLSTFLDTLINDGLFYVKFDITLAHLRNDATDDEMAVGTPGVVNRITGFVFDNPAHFTPTMYDEVFLFAAETYFHFGSYSTRFGNPGTYPADRLGNQELVNLSAFMDGGGGVFATGDHGALGKGIGNEVKRIRNMRYWDSTSNDFNLDEVSMSGPRRNDTNHIGHNATQEFDDQSDDIPQTIQPRLYRTRFHHYCRGFYPHPLLCGPNGIIRVLPDHPHEGECIVPSDLTLTYPYDNSVEYPNVTGGTYRISPEIVATSVVPSGNTAGFKSPTVFQRFGAICAYDGHRAGVGRATTDATWHHFININLVGAEGYPPSDPKSMGFLATPQGMVHLNNIKAYFRNIALWLARPSNQACFRRRMCWKLIYQERVIEAVTVNPNVQLQSASSELIYSIGSHARDVLHKLVRPCLTYRIMLDFLQEYRPDFATLLDPWSADSGGEDGGRLNWVDPSPLLDMALGAAIVGLRSANPHPSESTAEAYRLATVDISMAQAEIGVNNGLDSMSEAIKEIAQMLGGKRGL